MTLVNTKDTIIELCPSAADWLFPGAIPYYSYIGRSSDAKLQTKAEVTRIPVYGGAPKSVAGYGQYTMGCKIFIDLTTGGLTSVTITTPGTGYATAPTVAFVGGTGSGGAATAIVNTAGNVVAVVITNPGAYTVVPTGVTFTGGGGTGAAATVAMNEYSTKWDWPLMIGEQIRMRVSPAGNGASTKRPNWVGVVVKETITMDAPVNGVLSFEFQGAGDGDPVLSAY